MVKVSVITPVYNGARYLGRALDSVLAQTLESWELIVVDDGSSDATPKVLERYADARIITIRQEHAGEAVARNTGLNRARGEYVGFLDADDLYWPNALADLSAFLDLQPEYEAVYSDGHVCNESGEALSRLSDHRPGVYIGNILEPLAVTSLIISLSSVLIRRVTIEQHRVSFDKNLVIGPDWDFCTQLARHARFGYLDQCICMYRVHPGNITRTSGHRRRHDDLVLGRMKVLNAEWFSELSVSTRRQFFYLLLIELLTGYPVRQEAIMESENFRGMPMSEQAALRRQVGVAYILGGGESEFAMQCLQEADRLRPGSLKTQALLWTMQLNWGRQVTPSMVRAWRMIHGAVNRLVHCGQHRSKPAPAALRPVGD